MSSALPPATSIAAIVARGAPDHRIIMDALRLALCTLNTAPRFPVGDTDSYAIASRIEDAIRIGNGKEPPS